MEEEEHLRKKKIMEEKKGASMPNTCLYESLLIYIDCCFISYLCLVFHLDLNSCGYLAKICMICDLIQNLRSESQNYTMDDLPSNYHETKI